MRCCPRSPHRAPARNRPPDATNPTTHRKPYRPAPPDDRTRPDQVNNRPLLTMHEVVSEAGAPLAAQAGGDRRNRTRQGRLRLLRWRDAVTLALHEQEEADDQCGEI